MEESKAESAELPGSEYLSENGTVLEVDKLHRLSHLTLLELSRQFNLRASHERTRHQIIFDLLKTYHSRGIKLIGEGMLEVTNETYGFLRWELYNFDPCPEDVYVPAPFLKKFGIRPGNKVRGYVRGPRDKEKFLALDQVISIEGIPIEKWEEPKLFDQLTAMFPDRRILLENLKTKSVSARAVDLVAPLGRGQRGLIVAAPRTGKTILMKEIAQAILANSPDIHLILLLVDERPEEVTDLKQCLNCEIFSSTFDESPTRHVQIAELVSERAKRLVELRKDVVILLDSITRLARGYNALQPGKGRIMSGGVEAKALLKPKRFFGAARNCEEGGSLTILATALIETESRMDEVIFEEFKGTGNMELHLDRTLVEKRVFPAIHILKSGTRRDELLYHPEEYQRVTLLRKKLAQLPAIEAMEFLVKTLKATKTNAELLLTALRRKKRLAVTLITTNRELAEWTETLEQYDTIAVDTEGDSLHCYFEKLCLIQISVPHHNILIDPLEPLDFSRFNEVLARNRIILHGCDYDLRMLRRGIKFVPGPVFDTYLAARLIGLKDIGLASLVKDFFQIELPKSSQKANWARRPLTQTMLEYAVNDTLYLIELAERLTEELIKKGRLDWFHESCRKAILAAAEDREKDPERQWRITGSALLRGQGLALLRALWYWRDAEAQKADRPSFQIIRNEELIEIANLASEGKVLFPASLSPSRKKRLETLIEETMQLPESEWPTRIKTVRDRPTEEQERRLEQLKSRRDRVALELGLDPGVLAPKQALEKISREPGSLESTLMRWQRQALGL